MNSVTFVGYGLAFLIALIVAARWIYHHHPALREHDPAPPERHQDVPKATTRPVSRD
ncbi:MAG: hypothetical protein JO067_08925 [Cupriavidus sp.]|nr:hypothetical protein [Cupriavidus sp.]